MEKHIVIISEKSAEENGGVESRIVITARYKVKASLNLDAARGALWGSLLRRGEPSRVLPDPPDFPPFNRRRDP
jgi:hypothetical protein